MEVQFNNVTITVADADTADQAYSRLCEALDNAGLEYNTDTFQVYDENNDELGAERDTEELWGDSNPLVDLDNPELLKYR